MIDDQEDWVFLLLKAATKDHPGDLERLITELKNTQTALYYCASVIRDLDASTLVHREDD